MDRPGTSSQRRTSARAARARSNFSAVSGRPFDGYRMGSMTCAFADRLPELPAGDQGNFAVPALVGHPVRLGRVLQRKAVGDGDVGMEAPAHEAVDELLHAPDTGDPRADDGDLAVDQSGTDIQFEATALTEQHEAAPAAS